MASLVVKCAHSTYSAGSRVLVTLGVALLPPSPTSPILDASGWITSGDSSGVVSSSSSSLAFLFGVAEPSGCDGSASCGGVLSLGVDYLSRVLVRLGVLSHAYISLRIVSHSSLVRWISSVR